jgi:hypothetical protein
MWNTVSEDEPDTGDLLRGSLGSGRLTQIKSGSHLERPKEDDLRTGRF